MKFWIYFGFWILILGFSSASALGVGGSYENDILALLKKNGSIVSGNLNRTRLKLDQQVGDRLALHLEPRYYFLVKSQEIILTGASDLNQLVWDRVYLKYRADAWSLTAGKQRIAWGTGYIWNPVDIFNPFVLSFVVREEDRSNVESLRVEVPVGEAGVVDCFVMTGKPWERTGRGVRVKGNVGLFDLALSYVDQGTLGRQLGFDTAGDITKDVGVRGEVVIKTARNRNSRIAHFLMGGDYTLDNGVGLNFEYYFNGEGSRDKNTYDWGNVDQVGMDYLFFSANKILNEITTITGSILINLDDQSFLIYPQYTRNITQNLDLNAEAMLVGGAEGSEFVPPAAQDPFGFGGSKMALIRFIYNF